MNTRPNRIILLRVFVWSHKRDSSSCLNPFFFIFPFPVVVHCWSGEWLHIHTRSACACAYIKNKISAVVRCVPGHVDPALKYLETTSVLRFGCCWGAYGIDFDVIDRFMTWTWVKLNNFHFVSFSNGRSASIKYVTCKTSRTQTQSWLRLWTGSCAALPK